MKLVGMGQRNGSNIPGPGFPPPISCSVRDMKGMVFDVECIHNQEGLQWTLSEAAAHGRPSLTSRAWLLSKRKLLVPPSASLPCLVFDSLLTSILSFKNTDHQTARTLPKVCDSLAVFFEEIDQRKNVTHRSESCSASHDPNRLGMACLCFHPRLSGSS